MTEARSTSAPFRDRLLQALKQLDARDDPFAFLGLVDEAREMILKLPVPTDRELLGLHDTVAALESSQFGLAKIALVEALTPGDSPGHLSAEMQNTIEKMKSLRRSYLLEKLVPLVRLYAPKVGNY
jgi:hypothetical protein